MTPVTYRPWQDDDLDAVMKIVQAERAELGETGELDRDEMRHSIDNPMIDKARDIQTAVKDGEVVGLGLAVLLPTGQSFGQQVIYPKYRAGEITAHFITEAERQISERAEAELAPELPVWITRPAAEEHTDLIELFKAHGYTENRRFYKMQIDFTGTIPAPEFPEGIALRPFDVEQHAQAVYAAHQESFRDHFGYVEDAPYEQWSHQLKNPRFDPTLWFIAWDGDEIAGVALCKVDSNRQHTGVVDILGVRRAWRKRGLGMALLRHAFHVFQQLGFARVYLGVDAASRTNAVALYERAGMYVERCNITYRKVLRGNEADIRE